MHACVWRDRYHYVGQGLKTLCHGHGLCLGVCYKAKVCTSHAVSFPLFSRHHTVTRGITKGVKEDFRLAMERQVSRCGENLLAVLHRFCINEKIILIQSLP